MRNVLVNYNAEELAVSLAIHASKLQTVRELLESAEGIGDEDMAGVCRDALGGDAKALKIALDFRATFKKDAERRGGERR